MDDNDDAATQARCIAAAAEYQRILDDERPSSYYQCLRMDGSMDTKLYRQYLQKEDDLEEAERNSFDLMSLMIEEEENRPDVHTDHKRPRKKRKARTSKCLRPYYFDENGNTVFMKPRETLWFHVYCSDDNSKCGLPIHSKLFSKFRRRFRMPYDEFRKLLDGTSQHDLFQRWKGTDSVGVPASPLGLLLLGSLRYLGRGLTFDDLEEYTAINEETHRQFFHRFVEHGQTVLFPLHVRPPRNAAEYETHRAEFTRGGLWGAGFSTDATNVIMWRCEHNLKQANTGFKQSHPARSYNISVNHRREILFSTEGHPSRWNDKTLAFHDRFLRGIHNGKILQDVKYNLLHWEGEPGKSAVLSQKYRGAWGLCDNGDVGLAHKPLPRSTR